MVLKCYFFFKNKHFWYRSDISPTLWYKILFSFSWTSVITVNMSWTSIARGNNFVVELTFQIKIDCFIILFYSIHQIFQVYIAELQGDMNTCLERSVHKRPKIDVEEVCPCSASFSLNFLKFQWDLLFVTFFCYWHDIERANIGLWLIFLIEIFMTKLNLK